MLISACKRDPEPLSTQCFSSPNSFIKDSNIVQTLLRPIGGAIPIHTSMHEVSQVHENGPNHKATHCTDIETSWLQPHHGRCNFCRYRPKIRWDRWTWNVHWSSNHPLGRRTRELGDLRPQHVTFSSPDSVLQSMTTIVATKLASSTDGRCLHSASRPPWTHLTISIGISSRTGTHLAILTSERCS